jgi:hypothetical protein
MNVTDRRTQGGFAGRFPVLANVPRRGAAATPERRAGVGQRPAGRPLAVGLCARQEGIAIRAGLVGVDLGKNDAKPNLIVLLAAIE